MFCLSIWQMCLQLPVLQQLSELYLGQNYVSCGSGVSALSSYLETNCTLKVLHINNNSLTDVGCAAISSALASNTTLRSINMYGQYLTRCGSHVLTRSIRDGNVITKDGAAEMASVLMVESSSLAWISMVQDSPPTLFWHLTHVAGPQSLGRRWFEGAYKRRSALLSFKGIVRTTLAHTALACVS